MNRFILGEGMADFVEPASHFGLETKDFVASFPTTGVEPYGLLKSGLSLVAKNKDGEASTLEPKDLVRTIYSGENSCVIDESPNEFRIPDEVIEYAQARGVKPVGIVKAGATVLKWLGSVGANPTETFRAYSSRHLPSRGKLEVELQIEYAVDGTLKIVRQEPSWKARLRPY